MKKIECLISDEISDIVDKLRETSSQTRAEFNRRALEEHVKSQIIAKQDLKNKVKNLLND